MTVEWPKIGKEYYTKEYWKDGSVSGYKGYGPGWPIHRAIAKMLEYVLEPLTSEMKVLDVGGAFGYHIAYLRDLTGVRGFTVDASLYAIGNQAPQIEQAIWLDIGESPLPFPDRFFDRIVSIETMEHVYEPEVEFALSEMFRVCKNGGFGYSSIACGSGPDPSFIDKSHQTMHPYEWWVEMFERVGFISRPDLVEKATNYEVPIRRDGGFLVKRMKWILYCFSKE